MARRGREVPYQPKKQHQHQCEKNNNNNNARKTTSRVRQVSTWRLIAPMWEKDQCSMKRAMRQFEKHNKGIMRKIVKATWEE
jgi:hypothetical protein